MTLRRILRRRALALTLGFTLCHYASDELVTASPHKRRSPTPPTASLRARAPSRALLTRLVTSPRALEPPPSCDVLAALLESARSCLLRGEVWEERTPNRRENEEIGLTGFLFGSTNRNAELGGCFF